MTHDERKPVDIARIKAYCEKATAGPWVFDKHNEGMVFDRGYGLYSEPDPQSIFARETVAHVRFGLEIDAEFISQSRTDLPACVEEIERLRSALDTIAVLTQNDENPRICRIALDALGR